MTDGFFPSALRELRGDLTKRPVIVGMLALGAILGISGPFDTFSLLPAVPRIAYWTSIVVLAFATGSLVHALVHAALQKYSRWLRLLVISCCIGIAVTLVLSCINLIAFGYWYASWAAFFKQLGIVTLISGVIEMASFALHGGNASVATKPAALLERLSLDKRGVLVAVSAEDHYVSVTTTNGTELVLMRLSDALKEVGDTPGLQIHRSHWVALDQIKKVTRIDDRGEVTLSDGATRPISRGFMPAVRAAGLLPQGRNG
ncbi:MAG: LytTR family DNA-binding domain-containing protein [Hyphomicrobiales bacterium]